MIAEMRKPPVKYELANKCLCMSGSLLGAKASHLGIRPALQVRAKLRQACSRAWNNAVKAWFTNDIHKLMSIDRSAGCDLLLVLNYHALAPCVMAHLKEGMSRTACLVMIGPHGKCPFHRDHKYPLSILIPDSLAEKLLRHLEDPTCPAPSVDEIARVAYASNVPYNIEVLTAAENLRKSAEPPDGMTPAEGVQVLPRCLVVQDGKVEDHLCHLWLTRASSNIHTQSEVFSGHAGMPATHQSIDRLLICWSYRVNIAAACQMPDAHVIGMLHPRSSFPDLALHAVWSCQPSYVVARCAVSRTIADKPVLASRIEARYLAVQGFLDILMRTRGVPRKDDPALKHGPFTPDPFWHKKVVCTEEQRWARMDEAARTGLGAMVARADGENTEPLWNI